MMSEPQVVTKQRVAEHGEVYTADAEVQAMLALVAQETARIDSRFLEPACGNGNFLASILRRKLSMAEQRYGKSQLEFERYAVLAVSSVYGIDILEDNVHACRQRLLEVFDAEFYIRQFKGACKTNCLRAVRHILSRNIIHGDALTLRTMGQAPGRIVFTEWAPINGSLLKRRDFTFEDLLTHEKMKALPLFSDLGEGVFIPKPVKDYPPIHFLGLADDEHALLQP